MQKEKVLALLRDLGLVMGLASGMVMVTESEWWEIALG